MKVKVKDGKACEKILKIELDPSDVKREYESFYSSISAKAKIPGFRPGKAPRSVLMMHYQDEAKKNVLNQLISDSYREAIKEEAIEPIGYPQIDEVDFSEEKLVYRAQIEVRPKIKLSKVTGLQVKKEPTVVKPEEIEESLKRVQKAQAQYKTIEDREARENDYVVIEYVCKSGEAVVDQRDEDWVQVKEEEYIKGFAKSLTGAKSGDEKDISVTLPENFWKKEYAGKPAVFSVKVKELKEEILPEMNDDLAKGAGNFDSLAALKEKIRHEILAAKEKQAEASYEKALLDELIKQNKISLPEGMVARRLEYLVKDALAHYERSGFPKEKLEEMTKELRKDLEDEAKRQVHIAFLLDEISTKENLAALEEDFEKRYQDVAAQVHQEADLVRKYYTENHDARHSLEEQIRSEKAIQYLKTNAKTK